MTTWRDDLNRVVAADWGNGWTEVGSFLDDDAHPRWFADGTRGVHRKWVPGLGEGSYGVQQKLIPDNVQGTVQEFLCSFTIHYGIDGPDDRFDWYLSDGPASGPNTRTLRLRMSFGTLNVRTQHPTTDVSEDIVFDPDNVPADTEVLLRCALGADYVRAKIWLATDDEPGWQVDVAPSAPWGGGLYLWLDPVGAPGGGEGDEFDYGIFYTNYVQITVPGDLVSDSEIIYREAFA